MLIVLCVFMFVLHSTSCSKDDEAEHNKPTSNSYPSLTARSDSMQVNNFPFTIRKTAIGLSNYLTYNGNNLSCQGMAIRHNKMYRLYITGVCQIYDITDINHPVFQKRFELGSYSPTNHSNGAQFDINSTENILYVSGLKGKCYVEKITNDSSVLIQCITLPEFDFFNNSLSFNIVCGDDGYLWLMGSSNSIQTLFFAKVRKPEIDEGDVILTRNDIMEYWSETNYNYKESIWQGGKVYGGKLYYVFGSRSSKRHIAIYDTKTHQKIQDYDLNDFVDEEPEDCDFLDNDIILTLYGGKGYYVISPIEKFDETTGINNIKY